MSVTIQSVERGSAGERAGFLPGDILVSIDGHEIEDVLDYRFYMTNSRLSIRGTRADGSPYTRMVRKGQYDDLGLEFGSYLMDKQRSCQNRCAFCFIDQLPPGLRESLYFKDDDSRLSFLFGNYITLTNLRERDVDRILAMRISPVNISVHTMNPSLRVDLMKNPRSGEVLRWLPRLASGGIRINAQLVLCPGVNDGPELDYSLRELCALVPGIQSVAAVPVGLTRYRQGLPSLRPFTPGEAEDVLAIVDEYGDRMLQTHGARICFAADEFYLAAGREIPPAARYGDFDQLENGVGLLSLLRDEFSSALEDEPSRPVPRRITAATGTAAAPFLTEMARSAQDRFPGLRIDVTPIPNDFFGRTVTAAGLVTGTDLLARLSGRDLGGELLIPAVMLRREGDLFLDGMSVDGLSERLGLSVRPVPNDGYALLDAFLDRA